MTLFYIVEGIDLATVNELDEIERRIKAQEEIRSVRGLKTPQEYKEEHPHEYRAISRYCSEFVRLLEASPEVAIGVSVFEAVFQNAVAIINVAPENLISEIYRDSKKPIHNAHSSECYQRFPSPWLTKYLIDA